jgi:hypothetical protein
MKELCIASSNWMSLISGVERNERAPRVGPIRDKCAISPSASDAHSVVYWDCWPDLSPTKATAGPRPGPRERRARDPRPLPPRAGGVHRDLIFALMLRRAPIVKRIVEISRADGVAADHPWRLRLINLGGRIVKAHRVSSEIPPQHRTRGAFPWRTTRIRSLPE